MRTPMMLEQAISIQNLISEAPDLASFGSGSLGPIAEFLHADNALLLSFEPNGHNKSSVFARAAIELEVSELQEYLDHFQQADPILHFILRNAERRRTTALKTYSVFRLSDIWNPAKFYETKYYHDFFKGTGIDDVLAFKISLDCRPELPLLIGFHRRNQQKPFSSDEVLRASLIAPWLSSAFSRMMLKERLSLTETAATAFVKNARVNQTVFILDRELNCSLSIGEYPKLNDAALFKIRRVCHMLADSKRVSHNIFIDKSECDSGSPMSIRVDCMETCGSVHFVIVASLVDALNPVYRAIDAWALTPREGDVVSELYAGSRNAQIAIALGISQKTVENHISSIFEKANVTCRSELVSRLANGLLH